jgi:hypothetical protein
MGLWADWRACCAGCAVRRAVQLQEEVYEEAAQHGNVTGVCVPIPPDSVQDLMPGRCYIRYASPDDAKKGVAKAVASQAASEPMRSSAPVD